MNISHFLGFGILLAGAHSAALAAQSDPAITINTLIYQESGEQNSFAINIGSTAPTTAVIDGGFGPVSYDIGQAVFNPDTQAIDAYVLRTAVSQEGIVKIYCDPSLIDYLDMNGEYITRVEMPQLTNLEILNMDHNRLEQLDLSAFTKLQSISLSDNEFNVSPLVVGPNKPDLQILTLDIIEKMSPDFNISDYPALQVFSAWHNRGLHSIDPTGCPDLIRLSIDATDVASIDLSSNPKLRILNVGDTRINSIDLSALPNLEEFYCSNQSGTINPDVKFTSLDLSSNPKLKYLYCSGNLLSSIDLSHNPALQMLNVSHNLLTGIDLSNNPNLIEVNISFNYMDYTSMPLDPGTWNDYIYLQNPMKVDYSYPVGGQIDLTNRVIIPSNPTYATLLKPSLTDPNEVEELGEEYFSYANGVITLLKEVTDSVRVEFYNPSFPKSPLATTEFLVKSLEEFGKPTPVANWSGDFAVGSPVRLHVAAAGASPENPATVYVDFGDGVNRSFSVTASEIPEQPNVTGTSAGYGQMNLLVPDGVFISGFGLHNTLYSFNSEKMSSLIDLDLSGCGLYSIDLKMNNRLERLNLADNNLYTIDLSGPYDGLNKTRLGDINLAGNHLSEFSVTDPRTLVNLDLSRNQIAEISFRDADNINSLNVAANLLSSLDVTYCAQMTSLNAADNNISELVIPAENALASLNVSGNRLNIATLPAPSAVPAADYLYAQQQLFEIPTKGPGVNLQSQNVLVDGHATSYAWFKTNGTPCVEGTDYSVTDGKTHFINADLGSVFCRMTNAAFPALALETTPILAAAMPTKVVAQFTTPVGGQTAQLSLAAVSGTPAVYFDWTGAGDLEQYPLKDTYTRYTATTVAGAEVKVYAYEDDAPLSVFSITDVTMGRCDVSNLTSLICLTIDNAGLSEISLPDNPGLQELSLSGSQFSEFDLNRYPDLRMLDLSGNRFESLDLSNHNSLQTAAVGNNPLSQLTLNNPQLWGLNAESCLLTSLDFSKVPYLSQLYLSNNLFRSIDISPLTQLRALDISQNAFTFPTLPLRNDNWAIYYYANQALLTPELNDNNQVDLSYNSPAADGTPTVYEWYVGYPTYDEEGNIVTVPFDQAAYTIEDGVTTFVKGGTDLVCYMTNPTLENIVMFTEPLRVSAVDTVVSDSDITVSAGEGTVTVRCMTDIEVALYAFDGTAAGRTSVSNGYARFDGLAQGVYILVTPAGSYKLHVK